MDRLADLTRLHELDTRARGFTRVIRALAGNPGEIYHSTTGPLSSYAKAAAAAVATSDASALQREAKPFLNVVERPTILGQLGALSAPPYVSIPSPSADPVADWVSEAAPIPVQRITFTPATSGLHKFAFILPITLELARSVDDRALSIIERLAGRVMRKSEDRLLLLRPIPAVAGQQPAGLLFGVTATGGGSPDSLAADLELLWTDVEYGDADRPFYIGSKRGGQYLAGLHVDGVPLFPNAGPLGGSIHGVPFITSAAAGNKLILIDSSQLVVTDEGMLVDRSTEVSLQMDDAPSDGAQSLVSFFQANAVAMKFQRFLDWKLTSDDAIGYVELPIDGSPA